MLVEKAFGGTMLVEQAFVEKSLAAAKWLGIGRAGMCLVQLGIVVQ